MAKAKETQQIRVDIPQVMIDEAAGKELESARRKINRLESKIKGLEHQIAVDSEIVKECRDLKSYIESRFSTFQDDW